MLKGKRFTLGKSTLTLDVLDGKSKAVAIPTGATIQVLAGPRSVSDRMVEVLWEGRTLQMFAIDVEGRGIEISDYQQPPTAD